MVRGSTFERVLAPELLEAVPDALIVTDAAGTIVAINETARVMFGWARQELLGEPVERIFPGGEARGVARTVCRGRRRDGSELQVEIGLGAIETAGGRLSLVSIRDVSERLCTLEALEASERRLRQLLEQAPEGIFVADLEGRYTEVNSTACRMLGYTREELLGMTIQDVILSEDATRLEEARQALLTPGTVQVSDWVLRRKDGVELPCEVSATILPGGLWQAVVRDISARKRDEQTLRTAEERLRRAQGVAGLGSWDWDLETGSVYRSPELFGLYGVEPSTDNVPAFSFTPLIPEGERQRVLDSIAEAIRAGRSYKIEHRVVRPDGQERVLLQQGETLVRNGKAVRCVGTTLDITELRRAERERAAALAELGTVLEECPVGITIVRGAQAERLEPNRQARRMQGESFDPTTGLGQFRGSLVTTDGADVAFEDYPAMRALRGERLERQELVFTRHDGSRIPIEVTAAPICDASGQVTSAVVVWQDISSVKEVERLRAEWNSVVAHDLRQPINAINLYAQLLARAAEKSRKEGQFASGAWPVEALGHVVEIRKMTARLTRMTGDLLDLSRLDASRLSVERRPLDLTACVRESVAHAALQATDRTLDVRVEGDVPTIEADADRLAQVMENLLTNAIKYGRSDSPIRVSVEGGPDDVAVAVTSEGAELEPEALERIFQRFQRAGIAAHRAVPGIGLGLQITQGLVEAHGGRITATSRDGETTFRFTLPLRREV